MTAFRVQARRTTASGPPADLEFGELAYSDTDQQLYVGRADGELPPTTFDGTPTDYGAAIATLNSTTSDQAAVIAALSTNDGEQDTAISGLINNTSIQSAAFSALATDTQEALATKANQADLALVATSGNYDDLLGQPTLFSGIYADLLGKPTIPYGFTYDQQAEPSSPAPGATWRERSTEGLIVGDWEWSGSVWAGLSRQWAGTSIPGGVNITASTLSSGDHVTPFYGVMLLDRVAFYVLLDGIPDAANYWEVMMSVALYNYSSSSPGNPENATKIAINVSNTVQVVNTYNLLVTAGRTAIKLTKYGAAPALRRCAMMYRWRAVR